MTKPSVLVVYNNPQLPKDHPDAESEHSVIDMAQHLAKVLTERDYKARPFAVGTDPAPLWNELKRRKVDVVFNLFEGNIDNPETESFVAGLLEWSGIPYTGSPPPTLSLARAKHKTKYVLKGAGLPTADFLVVGELPMPESTLEFPVIVKPAEQDGSLGLDQDSVCTNPFQMEQRVEYILTTYGAPVMVEEYVPGRELNVALIELPELETLPPSEITFPEEKPGSWSILTYDGKWNPGTSDYDTTPPKFPAELPRATVRKLSQIAKRAYRVLHCRDYARVDFRMNPAGKVYILEVNPNPDISHAAGFAGCLNSVQFAYPDFVTRLVEQALSRKNLPKPHLGLPELLSATSGV